MLSRRAVDKDKTAAADSFAGEMMISQRLLTGR
jgi:hypothetical protein